MKPGNTTPGRAASGKEEKNKIITRVKATLRAAPKITDTRKTSKRDPEARTEKYKQIKC